VHEAVAGVLLKLVQPKPAILPGAPALARITGAQGQQGFQNPSIHGGQIDPAQDGCPLAAKRRADRLGATTSVTPSSLVSL